MSIVTNQLAPIVLFVYNRPTHTRKTLESLRANLLASESNLYIYADGPKVDASDKDLQNIYEVRKVIREQQWCKKIIINEFDKNKGLRNYLPETVSKILEFNGKIVVLEDDLVLSPGFLKYMNDALTLYEDEERVMHVSGYTIPTKVELPETFFLKGAINPWGWATWKRAWNYFNPSAKYLLKQYESNPKIQFVDNKEIFNAYEALKKAANSSNPYWDIRWITSVLLRRGFAIFPGKSLVNNMGFDSSGMHCENTMNSYFNHNGLADSIKVERIAIVNNEKVLMAMRDYTKQWKRLNILSLHERMIIKLRKYFF